MFVCVYTHKTIFLYKTANSPYIVLHKSYKTTKLYKRIKKRKGGQKDKKGEGTTKLAGGRDDLLQLYEDNLRKYRSNIMDVLIKGDKFRYHLIFATRETKGGTPWLKAVKYIKDNIEEFGSEKLIRAILGYLSGKNPRLTDF